MDGLKYGPRFPLPAPTPDARRARAALRREPWGDRRAREQRDFDARRLDAQARAAALFREWDEREDLAERRALVDVELVDDRMDESPGP